MLLLYRPKYTLGNKIYEKISYKKNNYREQYLPCLQSEYLHAIAISSQPLVSILSNWLLVLVSIAEEEVLKCSIV